MVGVEVEEALGANAFGGRVDVWEEAVDVALDRAVGLAQDEFVLVFGLYEVIGGVVDEFALVDEAKGEGGGWYVGAGGGVVCAGPVSGVVVRAASVQRLSGQ